MSGGHNGGKTYWKCTRCNEGGSGSFDMHVCEGKRNLEQMPLDLLREVCSGDLSEEEAWKLADERRADVDACLPASRLRGE